MMFAVRIASAAFLAAALCAQAPAPKPARRALLVANSQYRNLGSLPTPKNDVKALSAALTAAGFAVTELSDLPLSGFVSGFEETFLAGIQPGDICLIYFSGFAIQFRGDNFLLPVDFDPESPAVDRSAYSITRLLYVMERRQAGLKMIVGETGWDSAQLQAKGFLSPASPSEPPGGSLVAFSHSPGGSGTALAGEAALFTTSLIDVLATPGLSLNDVFHKTRDSVMRRTNQSQEPFWIVTSAPGFFFHDPPPVEVREVRVVKEVPVEVIKEVPVEVIKEVPVIREVETNDPFRPNNPFMNKNDRQEYILIPAGKFQMGCVPETVDLCQEDEKPRHEVEIKSAFWIGRTEVEVRAYRRYTEATKSKMPPAPMDNGGWKKQANPIVRMTWEEARDYCAWAGPNGRLPTEAEWEYAARGGVPNQTYPMTDLQASRDKANFDGNSGNDSYEFTAPVKSFDPNGFGLFDMAGNVWEWVHDFYDPAYYASSAKQDPKGPATGTKHVARGGSFQSDPLKHLRISIRDSYDSRSNKVGFRCVVPDSEAFRSQLMR